MLTQHSVRTTLELESYALNAMDNYVVALFHQDMSAAHECTGDLDDKCALLRPFPCCLGIYPAPTALLAMKHVHCYVCVCLCIPLNVALCLRSLRLTSLPALYNRAG